MSNPRLRPFTGLRVADFAWVIAGPLATQYLAVHGAEVIRIESRGRPDVLRAGEPFIGGEPGPNTTAYFANVNLGKRGVTLNLRDLRAADLAKRLVATCDIVTENFTPGTMAKLGLGYEALRAVRPDMIMISMGLAGQTGPERHHKGFGTVIQGSAGVTHLTGWPDRPPVGTGVAYTDFVASHMAAFALLSALEHRRRTGEGQYIDLSQQEASMYVLDAALLDYATNGHVQSRQGNRHPHAAPHGAFPCAGDDAWVAIAVYNDGQWQRLVTALGRPAWATGARFATLLGRKEHEDELEQLISAWTRFRSPAEVARVLRAVDVPCAPVADMRDVHADSQLMHRGHFLHIGHPVQGDFPYDALSYRVDGATPVPPRPAPLLGQDNQAIWQWLCGLSAEEYQQLDAEGVFR